MYKEEGKIKTRKKKGSKKTQSNQWDLKNKQGKFTPPEGVEKEKEKRQIR